MVTYARQGPFLVADQLTVIPAGRIHRCLTLAGSAFERHHLLCDFSEEVRAAGLAAHWAEAQRVAGLLAGARGFGGNVQCAAGQALFLSWDYVPGRSLAQVLDKVRSEQIPLGIDQALTVLQGLAQAVLHLHELGLHHGTLSPGSVWVCFEGATQLLDGPFAAILQGLLAKTPALQAALAPYRARTAVPALQQDLFALGAVLYEMLTLEQLPAAQADIPGALARAALKEEASSQEIQGFLNRLLLVDEPFATAAAFSSALEGVLYDGDHDPTTFNMAFLMHTLFREEAETDALRIKRDQEMNFAAFLAPSAGTAGSEGPAAGSSRKSRYLLGGAALLAAGLFGGMFYYTHVTNRQLLLEQQSMQAKLAVFQKANAANEAKLADLARQEAAQKSLEAMFGRQAQEGDTEQARTAAKKDLEAARQKTRALAEEQAEALYYKQQLEAKQNAARNWNQAAAPSAAAAFNAVIKAPAPGKTE